MKNYLIVTHINPDFDSICFAWLMDRYVSGGQAEHIFINAATPDLKILTSSFAVGDCGRQYDPSLWRFDHHHLPPSQANETCAAKMLFEHLAAHGYPIAYLSPLIELVFQGDTGRLEANPSRELGLHALLSAYKGNHHEKHGRPPADPEVLLYGFGLLDLLAGKLRRKAQTQAELSGKVVYKSADGKIWAVRGSAPGAGNIIYEEGGILSIFQGDPIKNEAGEIVSYPIGVSRLGGIEVTQPHVGELVRTALNHLSGNDPLVGEMQNWFRHPAGFFAGRGTGKAPDPRPVTIDLAELARLLDEMWNRK